MNLNKIKDLMKIERVNMIDCESGEINETIKLWKLMLHDCWLHYERLGIAQPIDYERVINMEYLLLQFIQE